MPVDGFGCERDIRSGLKVLMQQYPKLHPIKLVAAEDEIVIERLLEKVTHVLPDGVGRALIPLRSGWRLLRR